jgi:hypothetical protein
MKILYRQQYVPSSSHSSHQWVEYGTWTSVEWSDESGLMLRVSTPEFPYSGRRILYATFDRGDGTWELRLEDDASEIANLSERHDCDEEYTQALHKHRPYVAIVAYYAICYNPLYAN